MDILRRNTDYALRMMVNLSMRRADGPISTKVVSASMDIPYQLACKLMQRLHKARLIESSMGPKGGFRLIKAPSKINLLEIIEAIQGPVSLNRCLLNADLCPRQPNCPASRKLVDLQEYITDYLEDVTLADLLDDKGTKTKKKHKKNLKT